MFCTEEALFNRFLHSHLRCPLSVVWPPQLRPSYGDSLGYATGIWGAGFEKEMIYTVDIHDEFIAYFNIPAFKKR